MIRSFRSRALRRFWERDDASKLTPERVQKIGMILDRLDASIRPSDLDLPGLRFHSLFGRNKGRYSVWVSGNWRITFAWEKEDAIQVDYEDYH